MYTIYYYDACTFSKSSSATLLCTRTNTEGVPSSYVEGVPSKPAAAYRFNTFRITGSPYFYLEVARRGIRRAKLTFLQRRSMMRSSVVKERLSGGQRLAILISSITVGYVAISLERNADFQLNKTFTLILI